MEYNAEDIGAEDNADRGAKRGWCWDQSGFGGEEIPVGESSDEEIKERVAVWCALASGESRTEQEGRTPCSRGRKVGRRSGYRGCG